MFPLRHCGIAALRHCGIAVLSVMPQIHQLAFHAAVAA
ncbi:hypothetical protein EcB171_0577 [Escherichia coli B171]|nr:hypothetical protein EcB171_0577 [Escherichia coli B171]